MNGQKDRDSYNFLLYKMGYIEGKDIAIGKGALDSSPDALSMYEFGLVDGFQDFQGKGLEALDTWVATPREERNELLFSKFEKRCESYQGETIYFHSDVAKR